MKASFNVLEQAWIPVVTLEGKEETLGIRETILRAPELREISSASPLEEYSIYRFLGLFLMDMLRPESESDIGDLLEEGSFDRKKLEDYIALCMEGGVSFDLFDEERPFLQSKFDPKLDGAPKPASVLDVMRASGNNHTHFDHRDKKEEGLSPEKAIRLVLTTFLFCTAAAQGYPSGVNASPPYYGVIHGENLFETLVFTLLPTEFIGIPLDEPPVLWRRKEPVIPKKEVGKTSWLHGMLFPTRRIHLIPNENGRVTEVYLCQGENYVNKASWRDPYVTYRIGKDGPFPLRPSADRAIWRNLCDIVNIPGGQASQLLALYRSTTERETADVVLYGVETSQASYLGIYRHTIRIPMRLTGDWRAVDLLQKCIASSENLANSLRKAMANVKVFPDALATLTLQQYYQKCETRLWEICGQAMEEGYRKENYAVFCDDISQYAGRAYAEAMTGTGLRASALAEAASQQLYLNKSIQKLKKEARL